MNLKKYARFKWYIVTGGLMLLFLLSVVVYVAPVLIGVKEKKDQIDLTVVRNNKLRDKLFKLESFDILDLEDKYSIANIALLPSKDPYKIFSVFDYLISKIDRQNINFGTIAFNVGEVKGQNSNLKDMVFSQTVKGDAAYILKLLNFMENDYPLMSISSVDCQMADSTCQINFLLHVYPEVAQIPAIDEPIVNFSEKELGVFDDAKEYLNVFVEEASPSSVQETGRINPFSM